MEADINNLWKWNEWNDVNNYSEITGGMHGRI